MDYFTNGLSPAKAYNRAGFAYLVFLAGLLVGGTILSVVAFFAFPTFVQDGYAIVVNYLAMYLIGFPLFLLVFHTVPDSPTTLSERTRELPARSIPPLYAVCYALVGAFAMLSNLINDWIGSLLNNGYSAETVIDLSEQNMAVLFVTGVIVAPIMEEIVFRGIPYKKLKAYGERTYILFTAIVFGLFHLNLGQFFYAAVLGLLFAKITWETGRIRYTILLHVLVNLTGGVGVGALVLRYGGEQAAEYYGYAVLGLMALGVVAAVVWLLRQGSSLRDWLPSSNGKEGVGRALLAPGCVVYYVVCLVVMACYILLLDFTAAV